MDSNKITVGDRNYTIERFRGSKASRVLSLVSRIGRQTQPILQKWNSYDREYREVNFVTVTRELAEVRVAQAPDDESRAHWQRFLDGPLRERESISWPQNPTFEQKIVTFFPDFFEAAEEDVLRLVALVLIPNQEMKSARRDGTLDDVLKALAEDILDELEIQEMAELLLVAGQVILNQTQKTRDMAGKFRELFQGFQSTSAPLEAVANDPRQVEPMVGSVVREETTEPSSNSNSSTDSPQPTDGPQSEHSSESSGTTSTPSAA